MNKIQPINGDEWMRSKVRGEHRVFRLRSICPFCGSAWCLDFTDVSSLAWIDPPTLGLSLLCGGCEARRRLLYVERGAGGRAMWSSPWFSRLDERKAWAVIRDPSRRDSLATVTDLGPYTGQVLRDDKRDVMIPIMREFRGAAWEVPEAEGVARRWRRPPPPAGFSAGFALATTKEAGSWHDAYN